MEIRLLPRQLQVNNTTPTSILRIYSGGSTAWNIGVGDSSGTNFNISADFGSILINKSTGNISISGSGLYNTVLHSNSTLTAGNLSGTIPSGVLGNSTLYVGTTAITLNRSSTSQTLTGISIDGNAATVGSVSKVQLFNNTGNNHTSYTTFAALPDFGFYFMQGQNAADAPAGQPANQYYVISMGLGNDYAYSAYVNQKHFQELMLVVEIIIYG
jgi:hypothetical protein